MKLGIIGAGLMGREVASALGRWIALAESPGDIEIVGVCDRTPAALDWFRRVPSVRLFTADYRELLADREIDVAYVAVPHDQHEQMYIDTLRAGKDLFAEKPFGIDLRAAEAIASVAGDTGRFVRCSSEFPFFPIAQRAFQYVKSGALGTILEVRSSLLHSSDLDPKKPINWKRQSQFCGEIGVMGDLGMHACHLPFRLGFKPKSVYAQLQDITQTRPDGKGGTAACDTWDNATLHAECDLNGQSVPVTFEMKRMAPGEANTWIFEIVGTDGGVRVSTKNPKSISFFERGKEQTWRQVDIGYDPPFKCITGGIFEFGFPDCFLQMWAAFVAERNGILGDRFGCATVDEAILSHRLFAAALRSNENRSVEAI